MTDNLFDNAKFGDMFLTTENKQAVFLRFAENAEYKFAILYVEGWGNVQVFRHNGKEIYNDAAHSIISKQEEPVSEDLKEFEVEYIEREKDNIVCIYDRHAGLVDGAKWQKEQMMKEAFDGEVGYWNLRGLSVNVELPHSVEEGDKVKVIVIKEE